MTAVEAAPNARPVYARRIRSRVHTVMQMVYQHAISTVVPSRR
jgi:hypothetical protein